MTAYPVLAVVDKRPGNSVIWHVQTDPDSPGILTGAWITADEGSLLDEAVHLTVGSTDLEKLADAVEAEVAKVRSSAQAAKKATPSITLPRFDDLPRPDVAEIAQTYHGEPEAREAWAMAVAAAEIVEYWHGFEAARKMRRYLADEYGPDVRPLPIGRDLDT